MSEETKDRIAEVIMYIFTIGMALVVLGAIVVGLFINPLAVLIMISVVAALAAIVWAGNRLQ